ncbi:MAG: hypothetical protein P8N40_01950 [Gammaproteobacteria bacterium]|nr:hypothetical protein [Gammaproteobacteria bacterium]|tara:strand:- start:2192 stop:2689 length:498 start_codon:yes stop_codon:yes gene_type:complete
MTPNFDALQIIAEIALGIVGFSAILIGLSRTSDGFSSPDNFRIQLLTYSAFGSMFCALFPFAVFGDSSNEMSWLIILWILCLYSVIGLLIFPRRMSLLRSEGHKDIFPWQLYLFQTSILSIIFLLSLLMITGYIANRANVYIGCLILFLIQSSVAFIRTMFVRVK